MPTKHIDVYKRLFSHCKHVYSSLFVSQGELHLHTDLWTCHPVEKTWAGRHCQCQCPELTPSFSPPDSFIGFVAPSPCHLQSQGSEWHTEEEVGPLTTPPASSNLHSNRPNEPLLYKTRQHINEESSFHVIRCLGFSRWEMGSSWWGPFLHTHTDTQMQAFAMLGISVFLSGVCGLHVWCICFCASGFIDVITNLLKYY